MYALTEVLLLPVLNLELYEIYVEATRLRTVILCRLRRGQAEQNRVVSLVSRRQFA